MEQSKEEIFAKKIISHLGKNPEVSEVIAHKLELARLAAIRKTKKRKSFFDWLPSFSFSFNYKPMFASLMILLSLGTVLTFDSPDDNDESIITNMNLNVDDLDLDVESLDTGE